MPRLASLALAVLVGCAPATQLAAPTPAEIPALEARLQSDAADMAARLRLAEAYRLAGRADESAGLLEPIVDSEPSADYFLGLVREDQERFAEARRHYEAYLARGRSGELRDLARDRIALVGRLELQQAVQTALAQEEQLVSSAPAPRTIGVFPFLLVSDDPQLGPLGTAMAELLTTDLGQTDRLTVLERARLGYLLDELALAEGGRVDPSTAARAGRMLGAGTIVQGRIDGAAEELTIEAAVLRVPTDTLATDPLQESDALEQIFEVEKRLAVAIYERSGIQLTAAERQRVLRQPTSNVQALLALGLGLEAQDAGDFEEAREQFARAVALDPNFTLANDRLAEADIQMRAANVTPDQLGELGLRNAEEARRVAMFEVIELMVPDPVSRDAFPEAAGVEGTARRGTAEIIIRRPVFE